VGPPLIIGVGFLVLGAFLMVLWWATGHREFFRRRTEVAPPDLQDGSPAA
jgi:hypothetical protein